MIHIHDETGTFPQINQSLLKNSVNFSLSWFDKPEMDITVRLVHDGEMRQLNQTFRGEAKTTDVLSFNQDFIDPETDRLYLGDIIISVDRAQQQARENKHSLEKELAFLAVHGTLHLLGFDHYKPEEKAEMWELQENIFTKAIQHNKEDD